MTDIAKREKLIKEINSKTTHKIKKIIKCFLDSLELDPNKVDDICF